MSPLDRLFAYEIKNNIMNQYYYSLYKILSIKKKRIKILKCIKKVI